MSLTQARKLRLTETKEFGCLPSLESFVLVTVSHSLSSQLHTDMIPLNPSVDGWGRRLKFTCEVAWPL